MRFLYILGSFFLLNLSVNLGLADRKDKVIEISSGGSHNCALFESGRVKCWGNGILWSTRSGE